MNQYAVTGEDVLLEALLNGVYVPFVCASQVDFSYTTELIEKSGTGLQGFKAFVSGRGEWGVTLSALAFIQNPSGGAAYTVYDTLLASLRKNGLNIRLRFQDKSGNLIAITGHVLIPDTGITSPIDGFAEGSVSLKGNGAFALSTTLVNPGVQSSEVFDIDYTSASGGETSLTYAQLINRTVLIAMRDGIDNEVVLTGTAQPKQVKFLPSTGTIVFDSPLSQGEWVHILYK